MIYVSIKDSIIVISSNSSLEKGDIKSYELKKIEINNNELYEDLLSLSNKMLISKLVITDYKLTKSFYSL